ncbi:MAG TPA: hypothetical protein VK087_01460 [Tissierellaceae bacterium]|nr:hypothetical protein [Tissierellaceae bacterium]
MNDVLLINKIDTKNNTEEKKKIFFLLDKESILSKLRDVLKKSDIIDIEDIIYKYNGVELKITTKEIPKIVKLLTEEDILIYSIYEIYNPRL